MTCASPPAEPHIGTPLRRRAWAGRWPHLLGVLTLGSLVGCGGSKLPPLEGPAPPAEGVTRGILHDGDLGEPLPPDVAAPAHWLLAPRAEPIRLDVSAVAEDAAKLAGRTVDIAGERAEGRLVVTSLTEVPQGIVARHEGVLHPPQAGFDSGAPGWRVGEHELRSSEAVPDEVLLGLEGKRVVVDVRAGLHAAFYEAAGHRTEVRWFATRISER